MTSGNHIDQDLLFQVEEFEDYGMMSVTNKQREFDDFSPEIVKKLIEAVHRREPLWNVKNRYYKNRLLRPKLWKEIAFEIDYDETKILDIRKKWEMVKAAYTRSRNALLTGSSVKKPYKFSAYLSFLDDKNEHYNKKTIFHSDDSTTVVGENIKISDIQSQSPLLKEPSEVSVERKKPLELVQVETTEDIFGKLIASELKSISEPYQNHLKLEIFKLIMEHKMK